jgi:hypothetical protein
MDFYNKSQLEFTLPANTRNKTVDELAIIEALDKNCKAKLKLTSEFLTNYKNQNLKSMIVEETSFLAEFFGICSRKIDDFNKENQNWHKLYQENLEFVEEFFHLRISFFENYLKGLSQHLEHLSIQDLALESKVLELEQEYERKELRQIESFNKSSKIWMVFDTNTLSYILIGLLLILILNI